MRKIVPPSTPPRPPTVPAAAPAPVAYAGPTTRPRREVRWARAVFWLTLVYAIGVIAWRVIDHRYVTMTRGTVSGVSLGEPFVVCLWGFALAPPLMAAASLLAVAAFGQAARGRYAGSLLITYALTVLTLIVIEFSAIASLVSLGTINYVQDGFPRSLRMGSGVVLPAALTAATLSVPLLAFLVPPLRRACFNSTNSQTP